MRWRKVSIVVGAGLILFALCDAAAGIFLCETTLHPYIKSSVSAAEDGSRARPVSITASDDLKLRAWYRAPVTSNGACAVLLHGVSDTHLGVTGIADFLVDAGYGALMPDSRAHGASVPAAATYGLREVYDVDRWVDWLSGQSGCARTYGVGVSMGGAILLQSLAVEKRFSAVVADSPFAEFSSIAKYRVDQRIPLPAAAANLISGPVIFDAFLYGRLRYGIDLTRVSPLGAVKQANIPILLIHGTADDNIPIAESRRLLAANPREVRLWAVNGAGHAGSFGAEPEEYKRRVLEWFAHAQGVASARSPATDRP